MTDPKTDPMPAGFRRLAEDEDGCPISAGGPPFRELLPPAGDRVTLILSGVPAGDRAGLVASVRELVTRAGGAVLQPQ